MSIVFPVLLSMNAFALLFYTARLGPKVASFRHFKDGQLQTLHRCTTAKTKWNHEDSFAKPAGCSITLAFNLFSPGWTLQWQCVWLCVRGREWERSSITKMLCRLKERLWPLWQDVTSVDTLYIWLIYTWACSWNLYWFLVYEKPLQQQRFYVIYQKLYVVKIDTKSHWSARNDITEASRTLTLSQVRSV